MPEINWDIASPPAATPPAAPFEAAPAAVASAMAVDRLFGEFTAELCALAKHCGDSVSPTYQAQAFVAGFLRTAEVCGIDLTDLALINPFVLPLDAATFNQALRLTTDERNASAAWAEEFRQRNPGLI